MFHKEYIRDRMLKEVARSWDMNGHVNEDSFDPLVNMLVTALASESELIYKEMNRSQDRVAGSLMSKLIPYVNKGVLPGHAMALLNPAEAFVELPKHKSLLSQIRSTEGENKEVNFITCSDVSLFNGGVIGMGCAQKYYDVVDYRFKVEEESEQARKTRLQVSEICIDVEYSGDSFNLKSIPLFMDLRLSGSERINFYEKLKRASFYINDIPVKKQETYSMDELIAQQNNPLVNLESAVCKFYSHQYFQLEIPLKLKRKEGFRSDKVSATNRLRIKIDFGGFVSPDLVHDLFCYVNAVPVVNVKEMNKVFKGRSDFSVFHLSQPDAFFCIKSVHSDDGKVYCKYDGGKSGSNTEHAYLLRKGEVEGLSEKGAGEVIDYLIGIMRNENAVLSNVTKGNFANDLKVLKQITTRLEHAMTDHKKQDDSTYIFIKDDDVSEYLFVDYYTTKGRDVKGLKVNSPLFSAEGSVLHQNGNFILTSLEGGRNALKEDEFLYEVRHAMLSGGRIVTKRDISSLVQKYYGSFIEVLTIEKGMMVSSDVQRGYVRTLDIKLEVSNQLTWEECVASGKLVLCELEERGSDVYPYRLMIGDKEIIR